VPAATARTAGSRKPFSVIFPSSAVRRPLTATPSNCCPSCAPLGQLAPDRAI
jgi:hypothetical protein